MRLRRACAAALLVVAAAEEDQPRLDAYFDEVVIPFARDRVEEKISVGVENASEVIAKSECSADSWTVRILEADRKVVIVGGGPAGLTAALYAARAELAPLVVAKDGGQLESTTWIDNFPGFEEGVDAVELVQRLEKQAERFGAEIKNCGVRSVDLNCRPFRVECEDGEVVTSSALIVATGASPRWLDVPGERDFVAKGVHTCATCDGYFYREKHAAVVGGGDTAMEQALFLARICERVTLVHRGDTFRASKAMATRVLKHPKILVLWSTVVTAFLPSESSPARLGALHLVTKDTSHTVLPVDAAFVAIGHHPNTRLFPDLKQNDNGYLYTLPRSSQTNVAGVFAAGDSQDDKYMQAVTAAASGAIAALDAERWLCEHGC